MISAELMRKMTLNRYEANLELTVRAASASGHLNVIVKPRNKEELEVIKDLATKAGYKVIVTSKNDVLILW